MNALVPCCACHRHVRASETTCPFCRAARTLDASATTSDPGARLGRAAIFAFRASAALALSAVSACSGGGGGTIYGGPPVTSAPPTSIIMQPYGAPPNPIPPEPPPTSTIPLDDRGASDRAMYGGPIMPEVARALEVAPEAPPETAAPRSPTPAPPRRHEPPSPGAHALYGGPGLE